VQVAPGLKPVTVVTNCVASLDVPLLGEGVPLVQVTPTGTLAPLFGMKSLFTVNVALFRVFVTVHVEVPPLLIPTPVQFARLAV
jgi:hypothetical protein